MERASGRCARSPFWMLRTPGRSRYWRHGHCERMGSRAMTAPAARLSDVDQDAFDFGSGTGPGRPGQVIRLHPTTRERHLDLLQWGLLPHARENPDSALRPIHARAETVAEH